jgi:hypothetical protein
MRGGKVNPSTARRKRARHEQRNASQYSGPERRFFVSEILPGEGNSGPVYHARRGGGAIGGPLERKSDGKFDPIQAAADYYRKPPELLTKKELAVGTRLARSEIERHNAEVQKKLNERAEKR